MRSAKSVNTCASRSVRRTAAERPTPTRATIAARSGSLSRRHSAPFSTLTRGLEGRSEPVRNVGSVIPPLARLDPIEEPLVDDSTAKGCDRRDQRFRGAGIGAGPLPFPRVDPCLSYAGPDVVGHVLLERGHVEHRMA